MSIKLTYDQVLKAAQAGEDSDWEFKSAKGGLPGSLWETYSAMANSEGGWILLGAREEGGVVHLDGLPAATVAKYKKALWDGLHNRRQISANLLSADDVQELPFDSTLLLAIHVPAATASQRPVYVGSNPMGGNTFRRRHEGDYRCSDADVRRMLADADPVPADQRILQGFTLGDLDAPSLAQYRQRFKLVRQDHAWLNLEDQALLEKLGGWRADRETGQSGLTAAGLLMFGKDLAIRDPHGLPEYFVDYREKMDPQLRWTDRIFPDGTWEANLFQFYQRVWPKLAAGLPVPFRLEGGIRRDETPAHVALREALVNALIHADYSAPGGIVLERYPDRFVFGNPGLLMVSWEQFRKGGTSNCRNKSLQRMFLMIGGGEHAGSGVDKIREGWKSNHWRPPLMSRNFDPDRIQLILPMASLIPDTTLAMLRGLFGSKLDALSPEERQALATAELEGSVSNGRLQELLTRHRVDISRMLQSLCERGYLVSDNRRRWATYQLATGPAGPSLFDGPGDSTQSGADSTHSGADSTHSGELLPPETAILERLVQGKRVPQGEMRQVIASLCRGAFLTADQIAARVHRSGQKIRERYLKPMVEEGLLRLRHPGSPNRPDQAYTAVESEKK